MTLGQEQMMQEPHSFGPEKTIKGKMTCCFRSGAQRAELGPPGDSERREVSAEKGLI